MKTNYFLIKGRVQGVSFRYYTQKKAVELNLNGTVRNLYDGDVEVYVQGEKENLKIFENFLKKGPGLARVDSILKEELQIDERNSFEIIF